MRLLHPGHDHPCTPAAAGKQETDGSRNSHGDFRQSLPLHRISDIVKAIQYAAAKINGVEYKEAAE
jgi:hypothetical protein